MSNRTQEKKDSMYSFIDHLPLGIVEIDAQGKFLHINPYFTKITGYALDDINNLDDWFLNAYPDPDYRERVVQEWVQSSQAGEDDKVFDVACKTGMVKTIEFAAQFLQDGKAMVTLIDISGRKAAEDSIKQSEKTLKSIFKAAPTGIGMVVDRVIMRVNDKLCEMTGYTEQELIGKFSRMLYPTDEDSDFVGDEKYRQIRAKGTGTVETRWQRKNGQIIDVLLSSTPLNQEDWSEGVTFTALDITQTKSMETQLRQAQKMEAIGTLVGGISHDFNNLLQAINGYAELLQINKTQAHPDYSNISALRRVVKRAGDLVRQLLVFSRKAETKKKPLEINKEMLQVKNLLEKTIPKMISIKMRLSDQLWTVHADPLQIEQVLLNLGSNAADAMPDGGVMTIQTKNVVISENDSTIATGLGPGDYVLLSIKDTGHGIDPSVMEKIFEPFFTTKKIGKGTGLGLSSVYGIVINHNGKIICHSQVGKGTQFDIYLPADRDRPIEHPKEKTPGTETGNETILLVDDESALREIAAKAFQQRGYDFIQARNGEDAIDLYAKNPSDIDLVILDLSMPGMGGYKCLEQILSIHSGAKVLIASGYASDTTIKDCLKSGAIDYIRKPYEFADLFKTIRKILDTP
ncbi:MAG: PAS domain S-box protein [Pseudomonadota bacterium]